MFYISIFCIFCRFFLFTYNKNLLSPPKKTRKKHPVYKDKSEIRRKVVIVRETLIDTL